MHHEQIYAVDANAAQDLTCRTPSIAEAVAVALQAIENKCEQNRRSDDYYDQWSTNVMMERPVVLMGVVMQGQTIVWLMDASEDAALVCEVSSVQDATGAPIDYERTTIERNSGYLLHALRQHMSWLVKEQTGEHLSEMVEGLKALCDIAWHVSEMAPAKKALVPDTRVA